MRGEGIRSQLIGRTSAQQTLQVWQHRPTCMVVVRRAENGRKGAARCARLEQSRHTLQLCMSTHIHVLPVPAVAIIVMSMKVQQQLPGSASEQWHTHWQAAAEHLNHN